MVSGEVERTHMTEQAQAVKKTRVERMQSYLTLTSTGLGVLGAAGTVLVWLVSSFYTGEVIINTDRPVESMVVKVFDQKGQQSTFYSKQFPLMPGRYHIEVDLPHNEVHGTEASIRFGKTVTIPVAVTGQPSAPEQNTSIAPERRRWWQVWRKKPDKDG